MVYKTERNLNELTVKKSNYLIRGRFSADLFENKLLLIGLSNVKVDENDRLCANLSKSQIRKLVNASSNAFYKNLKLTSMKLLRTILMAEDPETKKFKASVLVTDVEYSDGEGTFNIIFNDTFRNRILDIKNNFTLLDVNMMCQFDRNGTYRLYEVLRSYAYYPKEYNQVKDGVFTITYGLAELRCLLNLVDLTRDEFGIFFNNKEKPDYEKVVEYADRLYKEEKNKKIPAEKKYPMPKYSKWGELRREIIEPSIEEMREKTELDVTYEANKEGRSHKVASITFYIHDRTYDDIVNNVDITESENIDADVLLDKLMDLIDEKISIKDMRLLLKTADNDFSKIEKAYKIAKTQDVDNLVAFLIAAIKNDYSEPVKSKKKKENASHFSNERDYDYDELEQLLLNK